MRWRLISRPTASLPWMLATYLMSGLPFMCWNGDTETTITHRSRPTREHDNNNQNENTHKHTNARKSRESKCSNKTNLRWIRNKVMSAGARCKETVRHAVINGTCVIILISHRQQTHAYGCQAGRWEIVVSAGCVYRVCLLAQREEVKNWSRALYKTCTVYNVYSSIDSVHAPTGKRCCNRDRLGAAGWATAVTNIQLKSWNNTTVSSRYRPLYILQLRNFFFVCFFYDEPFPFLMKRLPLTISLKEEAWAEKEVGSHR